MLKRVGELMLFILFVFLLSLNFMNYTNLVRIRKSYHDVFCNVVRWLAGCVLAWRPFEIVFLSISGRLQARGRKKREKKDRRVKKGPNNPTHTYCKRSRSLHYYNPN